MNKEIEIKVKLSDYEKARKRIQELCEFISKKIQIDEYWTPQHKDIYSGERKEYWRIRKEKKGDKEKVSFEYHKPTFNEKGIKQYSAEYETLVENGKILDKIMKFIDARLVVVVEKEREYYHYKDFEICLDKVKELGEFLEIEAKKVIDSHENTFKECEKALDELGIEIEGEAKNYFIQMVEKKV